jgi:hypothetical protein
MAGNNRGSWFVPDSGDMVNGALGRFSGIVQADAVVTNLVASSAYTPGAGNIW